MIADMESNEKLRHLVTEFFLREKKNNIWVAFISKSYLKVSKTMRLNAASNHSFNIEFRGFMKLYKDYKVNLYSF